MRINYLVKQCWWCISLILIIGVRTPEATQGMMPRPIKEIKLEPISELSTDDPVTMLLKIIPKAGFGDTLRFRLIGTQGLAPVGSDTQTLLANKDNAFAAEFQIQIPDNDTSSLTVQILPTSPYTKQMCWFVTTECTVEYWKGNPRQFNGPYRSDPPVGRRGRIIPGEFPDYDSIFGIPPDMIHPGYREPAEGGGTRLFRPGRAVIEVDCDLISFPDNVGGIVFDTLRKNSHTSSLPQWSYLGHMPVDSLITRMGRVSLERQSQMNGIIFAPAELLDVFSDLRVRTLLRSYPEWISAANPSTDTSRMQRQGLPQRSRFYGITFSQDYPLDSAIKKLQSVAGVGVGYVGIPLQ